MAVYPTFQVRWKRRAMILMELRKKLRTVSHQDQGPETVCRLEAAGTEAGPASPAQRGWASSVRRRSDPDKRLTASWQIYNKIYSNVSSYLERNIINLLNCTHVFFRCVNVIPLCTLYTVYGQFCLLTNPNLGPKQQTVLGHHLLMTKQPSGTLDHHQLHLLLLPTSNCRLENSKPTSSEFISLGIYFSW